MNIISEYFEILKKHIIIKCNSIKIINIKSLNFNFLLI